MRPSSVAPVLLLLFAVPPAWARVQAPAKLVAPGDPAQPTLADACPTFHWGLETPAVTLELAVYRLAPAEEERSGDPQGVVLVAHRRLPGTARGWTPPLDGCFPPGSYGWLLRATRAEEVGPWSEVYRFEVPSRPSPGELARALAVLERYVAGGGSPEALRRGAEGGLAGTAGSPPGSQPGVRSGDRRADGFTDATAHAALPRALATPDVTALRANPSETEGVVFGAQGVSQSTGTGSAGVVGQSTAVSGSVAGVYGQAASAAGAAGVFDNTAGGSILRGLSDGVEVFAVSGDGHVTAGSFEGDGSELTNLPAGTASDLDCVGCVDTPQLTDTAVTEAKLAFDPATQAELDAEAAARAAADGALEEAQLGLTLLITGTANVVTFEDFLIESIYDLDGTADPIYIVSINRDRNQHRVGQALSYQILQKEGSDYWNLHSYLRVVNEDPGGGYSAVKYKVWRLE
jgi:hypothetical protein